MAAITLGTATGSMITGTALVPAIGLGIGLAAIVGTASLLTPMIQDIIPKKKSVAPSAPVPREGGSTSHRKKDESAPGQLSHKQLEEIEVAIKHAQIEFEIKIEVAEREKSPDKKGPPRAYVTGGMWNGQHRTLTLYSFGSFSGNFVVPPPLYMVESPKFIGFFLHQGCEPHDSKSSDSMGYVIYGTDKDRPLLLYILAWFKPAKGSPKVYVQAGLLPDMLQQPFNYLIEKVEQKLLDPLKDRIKQKLLNLVDDQTRQTLNELNEADQCSSYDPKTGAEAAAHIRTVPGSSCALLGATFSRREQ